MEKRFIQRFTFFIVALLVLQECHSFKKRDLLYNEPEIFNGYKIPEPVKFEPIEVVSLKEGDFDDFNVDTKLPSNDVATFSKYHNEKRFVGGALLSLGVISAGLDIYWYVRGCKDVTSGLADNIKEVKRLQKQASNQRDQINLNWNPIVTIDLYFTRLGASFTALFEAVAKLDSLKTDIFTLIDVKVFDRLDLKKRQIENQLDLNKTADFGGDPAQLERQFYTATTFALTLSAKLAPAAIWLGTKTVFPKIGKAIADRFTKNWAKANPNRVAKIVKSASRNVPKVKAKLTAKFNKFLSKLPSLSKLTKRIGLSEKSLDFIAKGKTVVTNLAKGAIVGLFVALEVMNQLRKVDDCKARLKSSETMLTSVKGSIANMTILEGDMADILNNMKSNYSVLFADLRSGEVAHFVDETIQLTRNSQQSNDNLVEAGIKLQEYHDNINKTISSNGDINYQYVETLVKKMLEGFRLTNFKLECYRKKLSIITTLTDSCAAGHGTYQTLWEKAKKDEGKARMQDCIENQKYLSRNEVNSIISGFMEVKNLSTICIRNNLDKQKNACTNWYNDFSDEENKEKVGGVAISDIAYFISICPPATVTSDMVDGICKKKSDKKTLTKVIENYYKFNKIEIREVYINCQLSDSQKENICNLKKDGYTLLQVQEEYKEYPDASISNHYNNCKQKMTPNDIRDICKFIEWGLCNNASCKFLSDKVSTFGESAVQAVIDNCSS